MLVGESLSQAGGGGLLERARELHPHARVGLVVPPSAWAERAIAENIRDAMALGRIDYYIPRPSGSRDEVFHEAISSFLLEWATERRVVPYTTHIVGEGWWGRAYELREVFERCLAQHSFWLADSGEGRRLLAEAGPGAKLPLMVLPDGRALSDPSNAEIAEAAGAPADLEEHAFDVAIVGAGPAGLSAAVYAASEGMRTLVVDEGGVGGQARSSSLIRNYLGFPKGVSGSRLAVQAYEQASVFGASFVFMARATALSRSKNRLHISLADDRQVTARAVILASGASYRRLGGALARSIERRRCLPRRPGLGSLCVQRQGSLRRGRRELGRPGRRASGALRTPRHARRARRDRWRRGCRTTWCRRSGQRRMSRCEPGSPWSGEEARAVCRSWCFARARAGTSRRSRPTRCSC